MAGLNVWDKLSRDEVSRDERSWNQNAPRHFRSQTILNVANLLTGDIAKFARNLFFYLM